ncbi:MAG: PH domain-containing protein [Clostridiales Family XIII bacterium]|jgi:putative membrane protein|nr:PH domain-containing protein [Clostridiales Family XIII bacterium]
MSDILAPGLHKLHKAYLAFFVVNGLKAVIIPFAILIIANFRDVIDFTENTIVPYPLAMAVVLLILLAVIFLLGLISYSRYKWELTESELRIYKGLIFRKKIRLPFTRINTIDANAKLVERIFGLVSMRFDTAGGSAGKADAMIPMLRLDEAEALKAEIFRRRDGGAPVIMGEAANAPGAGVSPANPPIYDPAAPLPPVYDAAQNIGIAAQDIRGVFAGNNRDSIPVEYEYRLSGKEIFLAGIVNSHAFLGALILFGIVGGLYGFIQDAASIANFDITDIIVGIVDGFVTSGTNSSAVIIAIVIVFVLIIAVGYIFAVVTKFITFGGFTIQKRGDRIEVSRGLLARKSSSIVTHRVQTLGVSQGLLMRVFGYVEVRAETASALAAQSGDKNGGLEDSVIHPCIKIGKLDDFIAGVIPEFNDRPQQLETLTLKALRRSMIRYGMWSVILIALPALIANQLGAPVPLPALIPVVVFCVFMGYLKWRGRAISRTDDMIAIRSGAIRRRRVYIPRRKIQHARKQMNPFQRMAGMATYGVYTAAMRDTRNAIKDITAAGADDYLEWVEPRHSAHRQAAE